MPNDRPRAALRPSFGSTCGIIGIVSRVGVFGVFLEEIAPYATIDGRAG
jgi:hypothetical protein